MKLAQDAYCKREGNRFLLGTGKVEKQVELTQEGQWLVRSLRNKRTGKEYVQNGAAKPDEFFVTVDGGVLLRFQWPLDPCGPGGVHRPPGGEGV